jgi:hypothetical protein
MPGSASILGFVDPTVDGAQKEVIRLPWHWRNGASIATGGTYRAPYCLRRQLGDCQEKKEKERSLREKAGLKSEIKTSWQTIHADDGLPRVKQCTQEQFKN